MVFKNKFKPFLIFAAILFIVASCVKEEYDFQKYSNKARINPKLVLPVAKGSLTIENAVKPKEDTLVFNDDGTIKLIFKNDSLFSYDISEIIEIPDPGPKTKSINVGDLFIDDFTYSGALSLDDISQNLDPVIRDTLIARDGKTTEFPAIPVQDAGTYNITPFTNFTQVLVFTGTISITITNHFPVEVSFSIGLKNSADNSPVGTDFIFSNVSPGGSQTRTVDISGNSLTNSFIFDIKGLSSPGSAPNDVPVNLSDNIDILLTSNNVRVSSGTAILPNQVFYSDTDFVDIDPDPGVEVTNVEIETGDIEYTISSGFSEIVIFHFVLSSALRGDDTLKYNVPLSGNETKVDVLSLANTKVDLTTDAGQPYNIFPFEIIAGIVSSGNQITFDMTDNFTVDYQIKNNSYHYIEGYFGQKNFTIDPEIIELDIDDFFKKFTGTITFTDPVIRIPYVNSIGVPANIQLQVMGENSSGETQDLNGPVMNIERMNDRNGPPIESSIDFDRNNSDVVELIALRPNQITYSGVVTTNPGGNTGGRNNFVLGDSQISGGIEVEVPWTMKIEDIFLKDTIENPFHSTGSDDEINLDDLNYINIYFYALNGFPVDVDFVLIPYDQVNDIENDSIIVPEMISAAEVDANGKVTQPVETTVSIEVDKAMLDIIQQSESLIIRARFNSIDDGTREVIIYTDYALEFKLAAETEIQYDFQIGN